MGSLDRAGAPGIDQRFRFPWTRQQDAAFLKGFADRRDPKTQARRVEPLAAGIKLRARDDVLIALVDTAAGKHQRAGTKVDLIMAHHHEDLDLAGGAVAQQQDGGRRPRRYGFGHQITPPRWIAAANSRACRPARPATADNPPRPLQLP